MMIKIFDSMSKTKKVLTKDRVVTLYLCGPTVYNYVHIGNVRPVIVIDVLHRLLLHEKYHINYVHNITDIDDKIINEAQKHKTTEKKISEKYYLAYVEELNKLNILMPTNMPKVSDFTNEIIEFINKLVSTNYAYVSGQDVYFQVDKIKSYGVLANKNLDELKPNFRITDNKLKQSPFDFALWKGTKEGLKWQSPFGSGRPGWHTECVVFIEKIFKGQTIDFHGGGIDLKFPHHENERAQFLVYANKELANIWWHNGHINFNNEKMSKSLGNIILVKDFCNNYQPAVLRYLILNHDHQQPINFTEELIVEANSTIKKYQTILQLWKYHSFINKKEFHQANKHDDKYYQNVINYLKDNLTTTNVLTTISNMIKDLNQAIKTKDFSDKYQSIFKTLIFTFEILGFNFNLENYSDDVKIKIEDWENLKKQKLYDQADLLRKELQDLDILPKI